MLPFFPCGVHPGAVISRRPAKQLPDTVLRHYCWHPVRLSTTRSRTLTMRSTPRFTALAALCLALLGCLPLRAQTPLPSIADKTRSMEKRDGFLPVYWEAATGKLWMEIPRTGEELIYVVSLPAGMGSNDIGLDRGQLGGERLVRFDRVGPRVLMVQPNQAYRA